MRLVEWTLIAVLLFSCERPALVLGHRRATRAKHTYRGALATRLLPA